MRQGNHQVIRINYCITVQLAEDPLEKKLRYKNRLRHSSPSKVHQNVLLISLGKQSKRNWKILLFGPSMEPNEHILLLCIGFWYFFICDERQRSVSRSLSDC